MSDQTFKQSMDLFHRTIAKYFPDRILELDILVAICASFFIRDISQPMALFLLGNPSSGKSTLLEMIKELPVILWRDNLTPAALLSASPNIAPEDQLLHQLEGKVLTIPEFAPLANNAQAKQIMPDFTRLLDGNAFVRHTGNGVIGTTEAQRFNMMGAMVRVSPKLWELFGNMGPRLVFLRLPDRQQSLDQTVTRLTKLSSKRSYTEKLEVARKIVLAFYENIAKYYPDGVTWNKEADDKETIQKIAKLAVLVTKMRAIIPKENRQYVGKPQIEDPTRIYMTLLGICKCVAFIRGRTHITAEELAVAYRIAIDSVPEERSGVLLALIDNDGTISTKEYAKITGVSRGTVYTRFDHMERLGICQYTQKSVKTKPADAIQLTDEWMWMSDEDISLNG